MWIYLVIGIFFIAIGLAIHRLKWYFLISGYNTMSKDKRANVDVESLGKLFGIYSYANGGVFLLAGLLHILDFEIILIPAIVFTMFSTIYLVIKSQKYDGNKRDSKQNLIGVAILLASLVFVIVLMYNSIQPTRVTFLEEGLEIHGMYGDTYSWDSIESAMLIEDLPIITMRTNGSALGNHLKGNFSTKKGSVRLHVNTKQGPFAYVETNNRKIIFNMNDAKDTQKILDEILLRINN